MYSIRMKQAGGEGVSTMVHPCDILLTGVLFANLEASLK